jgi:uncharacterized protein with ParB-like and HNH nuclease domain/predicted transport protein
MKATEANFIQFLAGKHQFIIPIYQRTYSWTIAQCQQLWDDILRVATDPEIPGHFVGSIVYIQKGIYQTIAIPQLLVIDGQQRLTTLSLLLAALGEAIDKPKKEYKTTRRKIQSYYLLNYEEEDELRYKLILTQSDRDTLKRVVEGNELPKVASPRIVENYQFFAKLIRESKIDLDTIYDGINKLIIVDVSLDRTQDNPQLIFESLNSTGLELSQADLIRNFILMGLEIKEQTDLYDLFWYPMEQSFGHTEYSSYFDRFMRDYLTIKFGGRIPRINEVYIEFKALVRNQPGLNMRQIVTDLYRYSKHFVKLAFLQEKAPDIRSALNDINILKVDVAYPFLLQVFDDYADGLLNKGELLSILRLVESYVFRRVICGIPTNSLNKTFATLSRSIDKAHYLESVQAALLLKDSYRRFPRDEEFRQQFVMKDVYNFRSRNYLLRKLENTSRAKELVDVEQYTIEHVLPQNEKLSAEWQAELGPDWQQIQSRYLHTIGNLTLTGYNSEYSDLPFEKKRDFPEKGFRDSPLHLNRDLAKLERWDEESIKLRAQKLAEKALQLWSIPVLEDSIVEKYKKVQSEPEDEAPEVYTLEHYEYLQGNILELFHILRHRLLNLSSSVREEYKKFYIAYKSSTNFVDIVPQKSRLRLALNLPFDEINDPKGLCKDVRGLGRWGNGEVEVGFESSDQIDDVMFLARQAFDWQSEE